MTTYLFRGPHLFPAPNNPFEGVEELKGKTFRCTTVVAVGNDNFMGANTWDFQIEGRGDKWYGTHYNWALVEDTPENRALVEEFELIHKQRRQLQRDANAIFDQIKTIAHNG